MSKIYRTKGTPEVHSARSKLDGVLQGLVEKKDESFSSPIKYESEDNDCGGSQPNTPVKRSITAKVPKKRKKGREDETLEVDVTTVSQLSFMIKVFDRTIDLAQFNDDTPLYSVCRAWMKNKSRDQAVDSAASPTNSASEQESSNIMSMPPPISVKTEPGMEHTSLRVPLPIDQPSSQPLDIDAESSTYPPPEKILDDHIQHWKKVRQSWREAGQRYENQYKESITLLNSLYQPT